RPDPAGRADQADAAVPLVHHVPDHRVRRDRGGRPPSYLKRPNSRAGRVFLGPGVGFSLVDQPSEVTHATKHCHLHVFRTRLCLGWPTWQMVLIRASNSCPPTVLSPESGPSPPVMAARPRSSSTPDGAGPGSF